MRFVSYIQNSRHFLHFLAHDEYRLITKYGGPVGVANKFWQDMGKTNPKLPLLLDGDQDFDLSRTQIGRLLHLRIKALYASTSDKKVTQRFPEHDECLEDPDAVGAGAFRYTYCRGFKEMMRIIFAAYKESEFRNLAEQILINLFEIQAPIVKKADLASSRFSLEPDATSNLEKRSWLGCLEDCSDLTCSLELAE